MGDTKVLFQLGHKRVDMKASQAERATEQAANREEGYVRDRARAKVWEPVGGCDCAAAETRSEDDDWYKHAVIISMVSDVSIF